MTSCMTSDKDCLSLTDNLQTKNTSREPRADVLMVTPERVCACALVMLQGLVTSLFKHYYQHHLLKKNSLTSDRIQNHGDCLYAQVCYLQKVSLVPTKDVCSYFHTTARFAQLHGHHDSKVLYITINKKGIKVAEYLQKKLNSNNACG